MFKSEVTNKFINIILCLALMVILLAIDGVDILTKLFIVPVISVRILYDLYKIIKLKKLKAD